MNAVAVLYYSIYIGVILGLLTVMVVGFGFAVDVATRARTLVVAGLFPIICAAVIGATVLSHRNLTFADIAIEYMAAGAGAAGGWLSRIATLGVLGLCAARLVANWVGNENRDLGGIALLAGFVIFVVTNSLTNAAFGSEGGLVHQHLYPLLVFTALYAARGTGAVQVVRTAKWTLIAVMLFSLVAAVVARNLALQPVPHSFIPGFHFRLWGVVSHANALAPLALLLVLLDLYAPGKGLLRRGAVWSLALLVLLLTQSKTTLGAAVLSLGMVGAYRFRTVLAETFSGRRDASFALVVLALGSLGICTLFIVWLTKDPTHLLHKFTASKQGASFMNLSGRDVIWDVALREWHRNPVFGFGPTMWDPEFRQSIGLAFAFSAHNQFLQSLGAGGLVGLTGLLVYLGLLARAAVLTVPATNGLSLGLITLLFVRCFTEAPFTVNTLLNSDVMTHMIIFFILSVEVCRLAPWGSTSTAISLGDGRRQFPLMQRSAFDA